MRTTEQLLERLEVLDPETHRYIVVAMACASCMIKHRKKTRDGIILLAVLEAAVADGFPVMIKDRSEGTNTVWQVRVGTKQEAMEKLAHAVLAAYVEAREQMQETTP